MDPVMIVDAACEPSASDPLVVSSAEPFSTTAADAAPPGAGETAPLPPPPVPVDSNKFLEAEQADYFLEQQVAELKQRGDFLEKQSQLLDLPSHEHPSAVSTGEMMGQVDFVELPARPKRNGCIPVGLEKVSLTPQQSRLLDLRHASTCQLGPSCIHPRCAQSRELWMHINNCPASTKDCKFPSCESSKQLLEHFRKCVSANNNDCENCSVVMRKIRFDRERVHQASQLAKNSKAGFWAQSQEIAQQQQQQLQEQQSFMQLQELMMAGTPQQIENQQQQKQMRQQAEELNKQFLAAANGAMEEPTAGRKSGKKDQRHQMANNNNFLMTLTCQMVNDPLNNVDTRQRLMMYQAENPSAVVEEAPPVPPPLHTVTNAADAMKQQELAAQQPVYIMPTLTPEQQQKHEQFLENQKNLKQLEAYQRHHRGTNERVEGGMSVVESFTKEQINRHLSSLNPIMHLDVNTNIKLAALPILDQITKVGYGYLFQHDIDRDEFKDYDKIVKKPMWLDRVKTLLEQEEITSLDGFVAAVNLVFDNAILYNGRTKMSDWARNLKNKFSQEIQKLEKSVEKERENRKKKAGGVCTLCGILKRNLEPIVMYCNGVCEQQKIRRGAPYYVDTITKENHYCNTCYNKMGPNSYVTLDSGQKVKKTTLQRLTNDAQSDEPWAQCDRCDGWVHQICALFNGRENGDNADYICPNCIRDDLLMKENEQKIRDREKRIADGTERAKSQRASRSDVVDAKADKNAESSNGKEEIKKIEAKAKQARELPPCDLSDRLEKGIQRHLQAAYVQEAKKLKIPVEDVLKVPEEDLSVRVVCCLETKHKVREQFYRFYKDVGYPKEFPVRIKCILLFQKIDGADVVLFGMYVYEYGHDCPKPNRRHCYISYLDSIYYFSLPAFRTTVYHALLVEYLRAAKERGFHTCHLWSCPPAKGDDYIFYVHPKEQQTPKPDRLCAWYHRVAEKALYAGVAVNIRNLWDVYLGNKEKRPTDMPYFDGDYFPGEVEAIIKKEFKFKRKAEEAAAAGKVVKDINPRKRGNDGYDSVMYELGKVMNKLRQNFIIIDLYTRADAARLDAGEVLTVAGVADEVEEEVEEKEKPAKKAKKRGGDDDDDDDRDDDNDNDNDNDNDDDNDDMEVDDDEGNENGGDEDSAESNVPAVFVKEIISEFVDDIVENIDDNPYSSEQNKPARAAGTRTRGHIKAHNKPVVTDYHKEQYVGPERIPISLPTMGNTIDPDPLVECEVLETRQNFLNYCTKNNTQFDELRRAKHTTMMLLYQLHNPDAARFVTTCANCYKEMGFGVYHKCRNCPMYDLCNACFTYIVMGNPEPRFAHDKTHKFVMIDVDKLNGMKQTREERQKKNEGYIKLVDHVFSCFGACSSQNCKRFKHVLFHAQSCKSRGSCQTCKMLLQVLSVHSKQCHNDNCTVFMCDQIKEKMRKLEQQQQNFNDRRRNQQNEHYNGGGEDGRRGGNRGRDDSDDDDDGEKVKKGKGRPKKDKAKDAKPVDQDLLNLAAIGVTPMGVGIGNGGGGRGMRGASTISAKKKALPAPAPVVQEKEPDDGKRRRKKKKFDADEFEA